MSTLLNQQLVKTLRISAFILLGLVVLNGCSTSGRYSQSNDSAPVRKPTQAELKDAIPTGELPGRRGNATYSVYGKTYTPMSSTKGFSQEGESSWYGRKFHGHLTSNGEVYDMFAMSAAHKTLPLPSYVRVTNLANNKHVVVRVNDRGPFHKDRIIDLSYSAAYKIGMLKTGTANVKVEVIPVKSAQVAKVNAAKIAINTNTVKTNPIKTSQVKPNQAQSLTKNATPTNNLKQYFIQVFASGSKTKATETAKGLNLLYQLPVVAKEVGALFKVRVGPIESIDEAQNVTEQLKQNGYEQAFMLYTQN